VQKARDPQPLWPASSQRRAPERPWAPGPPEPAPQSAHPQGSPARFVGIPLDSQAPGARPRPRPGPRPPHERAPPQAPPRGAGQGHTATPTKKRPVGLSSNDQRHAKVRGRLNAQQAEPRRIPTASKQPGHRRRLFYPAPNAREPHSHGHRAASKAHQAVEAGDARWPPQHAGRQTPGHPERPRQLQPNRARQPRTPPLRVGESGRLSISAGSRRVRVNA